MVLRSSSSGSEKPVLGSGLAISMAAVWLHLWSVAGRAGAFGWGRPLHILATSAEHNGKICHACNDASWNFLGEVISTKLP